MDAVRLPQLLRLLQPQHYRHAQHGLITKQQSEQNGLITKQQSEQIRRKLRDKLNSERATYV